MRSSPRVEKSPPALSRGAIGSLPARSPCRACQLRDVDQSISHKQRPEQKILWPCLSDLGYGKRQRKNLLDDGHVKGDDDICVSSVGCFCLAWHSPTALTTERG